MRVAMFSAKVFEREPFADAVKRAGGDPGAWSFFEERLSARTAGLAEGCDAVCAFVGDDLGRETLGTLKELGVGLIALRSAGFNHVDLEAAGELGMTVARVPAYSPYAVAEHAVALILTLNRKTHRAFARVREHNFALTGLMGFDLHGKTVGVVGTGEIGSVFARIMKGFGCRVLGMDPKPNDAFAEVGEYVGMDRLLGESDIVSLHCPLTPETRHLLDAEAMGKMKRGAMLINTSRGAVVDTKAAIDALKRGRLGSLGLDVYEEEGDVFFKDLSGEVLQDDMLARLLTFPNVLVTSHQAFFTAEAVRGIAETTAANVMGFASGEGVPEANRVSAETHTA